MIRRIAHKHVVELQNSVDYAKNIDEKNGNTLWMDAINREMQNLKVAFDVLEDGAKIPVGHNKAHVHLVFDIRMTLVRKARWVKDGHRTPEPEWSTFLELCRERVFVLN